ncbi:PAS domain-containing sensor histidine kinase [Larkinella sp. C7]|uniref:sensor histidine kinase n=1 Tax=Larkinella sp. C7 TaxID=2576607 RepID=UPI0011111287|nr:PAS domain-containing sensor histidine kinase [Larkinella sp. C7]
MKLSLHQQTEEQYRLFVENVLEYGIFLLDPQGLIQTWNEGAARTTGFSTQEVIGQTVSILDPPPEKGEAKFKEELERALQQGRFEHEGWQIKKGHDSFWANHIITPVYDHQHQLAGFVKIIHDLTRTKQYESAQQQKHQQERLLMMIVEKSPAGIALLEPTFNSQGQLTDFIYKLTNPANAATSAQTVEQQTKYSLKTQFAGIEGNLFWQKLIACYHSGHPQHLTGHYIAYGLDIWIDGTFYKLENEVLWICLDVSKQKQAQLEMEKQLSSLQEAKDQVDIDLVRIRLAEKEVGKALETERELNRLKTEFVNLVSHQFRNPLTSIYLKSEAMKRLSEGCHDRTFAQKVVAYSEQVGRDIHRLNKLISEVLFNERIRSGQVEIHQEQLEFVSYCRNLIHQQRQHDPSYERVNFVSGRETVFLWADPMLLEQILENLMSNALKYSADSDRAVEVKLEETPNGWIIAVKDYGIGIPAHELKHVNKSFYRATNTSLYPGTGLGLSLSHRFVKMHGGQLTIESEEGCYTLCTVRLPKSTLGIRV